MGIIDVKKMAPKVSVIIPVYNVEKYVEQSVLSILNQSLKEIEIIIVNDGSKDQSLEIVSRMTNNDKRVHIISTPNNGLSIARNIGLYNALGEYVYFFDSDDILEEKTLEECYLKSKSLNLDFLFFDATCFTDENNIDFSFNYQRTNKYKDLVYTGMDILNLQLKTDGYRSSACLSFINREFLIKENLQFYPRILHEDELFTFLLYLKAQKVSFIKKCYFHRRVRASSIMTSSYTSKNIYGYLTVIKELYSYLIFLSKESENKLLAKRINTLLNNLFDKSRTNLSTKDFNHLKLYILKHYFRCLNLKSKIKVLIPEFILSLYYK